MGTGVLNLTRNLYLNHPAEGLRLRVRSGLRFEE